MLFNNQTSYILMTIHFYYIFTKNFYRAMRFYDVFLSLLFRFCFKDRQESIKILCSFFLLLIYSFSVKMKKFFFTSQTGINLWWYFEKIVWWKMNCKKRKNFAKEIKVERAFFILAISSFYIFINFTLPFTLQHNCVMTFSEERKFY